MAEGFVIMQIGNGELDRVCDEVIFPALLAGDLEPRRVDRHNEGDLLKSEIVAFIERAEIIVADLTNERPNVYLEIGYAMGLGKKTNLILTARADHFPTHPNYQQVGKRIHFDLQGYDILRWDPDDPEAFREELIRRIRRRQAVLAPAALASDVVRPLRPTINQEWLDRNREAAQAGLQALGLLGFWETIVTIQPSGDWPQQQLRDAVAASTIRTFGWPIGISFDRDGQRPRPTAGGVVAQVTISSGQSRSKSLGSYDYWNLQRTGDFYFLRSIFEDELGRTTELFYNTRIVQVTEMLLFLAWLYGQQLRLTDSTILSIKMTHGGLEGRYLTAIGSRSSFSRTFGRSAETQIETDLTTTVGELEPLLVEHVKTLLAPVFTLFDFTAIHDSTWTDIVDRFVAGDVS